MNPAPPPAAAAAAASALGTPSSRALLVDIAGAMAVGATTSEPKGAGSKAHRHALSLVTVRAFEAKCQRYLDANSSHGDEKVRGFILEFQNTHPDFEFGRRKDSSELDLRLQWLANLIEGTNRGSPLAVRQRICQLRKAVRTGHYIRMTSRVPVRQRVELLQLMARYKPAGRPCSFERLWKGLKKHPLAENYAQQIREAVKVHKAAAYLSPPLSPASLADDEAVAAASVAAASAAAGSTTAASIARLSLLEFGDEAEEKAALFLSRVRPQRTMPAPLADPRGPVFVEARFAGAEYARLAMLDHCAAARRLEVLPAQ